MKPSGKAKSDSLEREVKPLSYDIVGDIGILRLENASQPRALSLAEALMKRHKNVRAVLRQVGAVSGDFRLHRLAWVKGTKKYKTFYKEHGCIFKVDLKNCYFSPRLSHERLRLASLVKPNESIVNMFAGVGSFSVMMAKFGEAKRVSSTDVNPIALQANADEC